MRPLHDLELAWAAGFLDGEGGFYTHHRNGRLYSISCIVAQNEPEPLERFLSAVGVGKIYGPYQRKGQKNPQYRYQVQSEAGVKRVIELLNQFLCSTKSKQAADLVEAWDGRIRLRRGNYRMAVA